MEDSRRKNLLALALGLVASALVLYAQRDVGIARDEVVYMNSGSRYVAWWGQLVRGNFDVVSEKEITAHFGGGRPTSNNREHPPLMKSLFGASELLFHRWLGWTTARTAYRLPTALLFGLLVALLFGFVWTAFGRAEAVISACLVLCTPRLFFHAGLAAFDAPVVAMWWAFLFAYWKALSSARWCIGAGLLFGLALATKHNALLLPAVVGLHLVWLAVESWLSRPERSVGELVRAPFLVQPLLLPALAVLGPLTLFALWPWLWLDPIGHATDWIRFHLDHVHYNFEYLGENYNQPPFPWHSAPLTLLFTLPTAALVAAVVGAAELVSSRDRGRGTDRPGLLVVLSAAVAVGVFLVPTTPIFGASKHYLAVVPAVAIAAAVGVVASARWFAERWAMAHREQLARSIARVAVYLVGAAVIAAAAAETVSAHPYGLTHYSALAGGPAGGADLGMNRQYWGYAARGVLPELNRYRPDGGRPRPVYSHDASPAWGLYAASGELADGLPDAGHERRGIRRSQLAIVIHERHFARHDLLIWKEYGAVRPVFVLTHRGVPVVSVYARRHLEPRAD